MIRKCWRDVLTCSTSLVTLIFSCSFSDQHSHVALMWSVGVSFPSIQQWSLVWTLFNTFSRYTTELSFEHLLLDSTHFLERWSRTWTRCNTFSYYNNDLMFERVLFNTFSRYNTDPSFWSGGWHAELYGSAVQDRILGSQLKQLFILTFRAGWLMGTPGNLGKVNYCNPDVTLAMRSQVMFFYPLQAQGLKFRDECRCHVQLRRVPPT